jgi:hypothetical protein
VALNTINQTKAYSLYFNVYNMRLFEFVIGEWIYWDYLNLSLANEYVGDVIIPTQVIKYKFTNVVPGGSANQIAVFTSN